MKQIAAVLLCFLMFSAFDWTNKKKVSAANSSRTTYPAYSTYKKEVSPESSYQPSKAVKQSSKMANQNVGAIGTLDVEAINAATRLLGTGTPEERQARLESLKKLSEVLSRK